ncbi:HAD family hydrolase [Phenylobacterium sp. LjRoot219]|uniref:HAD family hydrolase n=1 Tax=Phenylobacterium sp. LjRoot219 TaxID=3342283 RepID=UPI003ECEF27A
MTRFMRLLVRASAPAAAAWLLSAGFASAEALASWHDTNSRRAIESFVTTVTTPGADFVPPAERIAVFDNDGTLWTEQPIYTEFAFSLARAAEMAKADPQLLAKPGFKAAASGDPKQIAALSEKDLLKVVVATHANVTTEEFAQAAKTWLAQARHPRFHRAYDTAVYQPMLELISYLREHDFNVFIVSGGDADFMRTFAERTYGVPPDQVIGSSSTTQFDQRNGRWVLVRQPQMSIDDKAAKPSNIGLHIGARPIFAAGNSDGDLQMLQYTTSGPGRRMGLIVHHDDAQREYAYDRASKIGTLDKALDEAARSGWTVVSMKGDWKTVFPAAVATPRAP